MYDEEVIKMKKVSVSVKKIVLPTYPEPEAEAMPMFAENRVHQRSSGRPYPNKVVLQVERSQKIDKEYTVVCLENDYLYVEILPEIGGRIYSAKDKTTGYDFFYKQHVIKPALIGVLGSWISGGLEFNWPFHHRASGFMPCDFMTEELQDGSAICWLSEHDPMDRMRGSMGIILRPECSYLETRMVLYNRTEVPHSFLWWENAAVPVNEEYRIFFPPDVTYVNFHYQKSRISYPIAGNNVFNGIPMIEDRDISWHKNTREATSYFASASDFDFFGGYDYGKQCGVVHIGNHHVTPGKKLFTWAYGQLAKSWENALTDSDGAYAELMAGSYSDNQPDFSWLAPYETKKFSQYWYPISQIGSPVFANLHCAFRLERLEKDTKLWIQTTERFDKTCVTIWNQGKRLFEQICAFSPEKAECLQLDSLPVGITIRVESQGKILAEYTEKKYDKYTMPEPTEDLPAAEEMNSVQELYLAGVHVDQYRDPAVNPDAYWKEALRRDPNHIPSLISMAEYEYKRYAVAEGLVYAENAIELETLYNKHPQSGKSYYVRGLLLEAAGEYQQAYDSYQKAAWAADQAAAAMTRIARLDLKNKNWERAESHSLQALEYGVSNTLAAGIYVISQRLLGKEQQAELCLEEQLRRCPLDLMNRYLMNKSEFYETMCSNPAQSCLDLAIDLAGMGRTEDAAALLLNLVKMRPEAACKMVFYALGYYDHSKKHSYYEKGTQAVLGQTFPFRYEELQILQDVIRNEKDQNAVLLLGNLLYHKQHYVKAAELWQNVSGHPEALRNLAIAYFSHLGREGEALSLMKQALALKPQDEQLLYETVVLMDKLGTDPVEKISLLSGIQTRRDDLLIELAKAYNQNFQMDQALEVLTSHDFVPCEGGEHAVAEQYMFAYLIKGVIAYREGKLEEANEYFSRGQELPQNLGAGIWNHCKRVPLKYYQSLCLNALGKCEEAEIIWKYIADIRVEYFSNMHLKELPFYQSLCLAELGRNTEAVRRITVFMRQWNHMKNVNDSGYFNTTPFFISFVDDPAKLRTAQYLYLTGLCYRLKGDKETFIENMKKSAALNSENLFAVAAAKGYLFD